MDLSPIETALIAVSIVLIIVVAIACLYGVYLIFVMLKTLKRVNFLIEDTIYKSEALNPTVETVSKFSNYLDLLDVVVKKNWKTGLRLLKKNKGAIYDFVDRIKNMKIDDEDLYVKKDNPKFYSTKSKTKTEQKKEDINLNKNKHYSTEDAKK